jgi:hypothetical protein
MSPRIVRKTERRPRHGGRHMGKAFSCERCGHFFGHKPFFNEEYTCLYSTCHWKASLLPAHYTVTEVQ